MTYSVDTSALLNGWAKYYPPIVFESVWRRIDEIVHDGRFLAPDEVLRELEKQADDLHDWVKQRPEMFVNLDASIQQCAAGIIGRFPSLVNTSTVMRGAADPFVIALAHVRGLTVVSDETLKPTRPRIPDVCATLKIRCIPLVQMFREEGWRV